MSKNKTKTGLSFTISAGKLDTIRGQAIPPGTIAVPGVECISVEKREITPRAIQMTIGLFQFAERCNRKEPNDEMK